MKSSRKLFLMSFLIILLLFLLCYYEYNYYFIGKFHRGILLAFIVALFIILYKLNLKKEIVKYLDVNNYQKYSLKNFDKEKFYLDFNDRLISKEIFDDLIKLKYIVKDKFKYSFYLIVFDVLNINDNIINQMKIEINNYKRNNMDRFSKYDVFFVVFTKECSAEMLNDINSEILSYTQERMIVFPNGICIPIIINIEENKLYIAKINDENYRSKLYYSGMRKKIKKYLDKQHWIDTNKKRI